MKGGMNPRGRIEVKLPTSAMQEIESTGWDKCTDGAVMRIQARGPASIVCEQGLYGGGVNVAGTRWSDQPQ